MLIYKQYTERINALHAVIRMLCKNKRSTLVEEGKCKELERQRAKYALKHKL